MRNRKHVAFLGTLLGALARILAMTFSWVIASKAKQSTGKESPTNKEPQEKARACKRSARSAALWIPQSLNLPLLTDSNVPTTARNVYVLVLT